MGHDMHDLIIKKSLLFKFFEKNHNIMLLIITNDKYKICQIFVRPSVHTIIRRQSIEEKLMSYVQAFIQKSCKKL